MAIRLQNKDLSEISLSLSFSLWASGSIFKWIDIKVYDFYLRYTTQF